MSVQTISHHSRLQIVKRSKHTRVAQRSLVSTEHVTLVAHARGRSVVSLLAVEGVLAAELLEGLLAVVLGLLGGVYKKVSTYT